MLPFLDSPRALNDVAETSCGKLSFHFQITEVKAAAKGQHLFLPLSFCTTSLVPGSRAVSPKQSQNQTLISTQSSSVLLDPACMCAVLSCCSQSLWASSWQCWDTGAFQACSTGSREWWCLELRRGLWSSTPDRGELSFSCQDSAALGVCADRRISLGWSRTSPWGGRRLLGRLCPSGGAALSPLQQWLCSLIAGVPTAHLSFHRQFGTSLFHVTKSSISTRRQ